MEAVPFSEPPWLNGHPSPYYNESHREWQRFCRQYISETLTKHAMQWENEGNIPEETYGRFLHEDLDGTPLTPYTRTVRKGQYAYSKPACAASN